MSGTRSSLDPDDAGQVPDLEAPFDPDRVAPFLVRESGCVSMLFELSSIQSRMDTGAPFDLVLDYTRAMVAALLFAPQPRTVLMIGLGGGSLVKYLHRHVTSAVQTVVDINPHVIALRDTFEVPQDDDRLSVLCSDGAAHVAQTESSYDWILVDGFSYEGQPECLCTPDFYAHCRERLAPGGVLVVNLQADGVLELRLLERLRACFDGCLVSIRSEDGGNRIVFAGAPCRPGQGLGVLRRRWARLEGVHRATLAHARPALMKAMASVP